jgi:hypothetical protein
MSLIQEALKRQMEGSDDDTNSTEQPAPPQISPPESAPTPEATEEQPATNEAIPPAPTPIPSPASESAKPEETEEEEEKRETDETTVEPEEEPGVAPTRTWPVIVGICLILLLIVVGGTWGLMYTFQKFKQKEAPATEEHVEAIDQEVDVTEDLPPEDEPEHDTEQEPPLAVDTEPIEDDVSAEPKKPVAQAKPVSPPVTKPKKPKTRPKPKPPPVEWPFIAVTGVFHTDRGGSAILNGEIINIGDRIEGVKLIAIEKQKVILEYKGEKQSLSSGDATQ